VLTHADFYYWGDFQNYSRQGRPLPIKVTIPVDLPRDANANPAWNTLVVSYNYPDLQNFEAVILVRLAEINRLTGSLKIVALFDSKKQIPTGYTEGSVKFNSAFDFYENLYLIELDLLSADVEDVSNIAYKISLMNNFIDDGIS
jgi:hypothetical protein